ncbi:MAG: Maf family protein [Phycisphaerae bacterium]|nr:Maf family protein [Phycisphaerae bacterium]
MPFGKKPTRVPLAVETPGAPPLLWLASRSPRRRQLLTEAGLKHVAEHPGIEDSELVARPGAKPDEWVASLAYLKACAGAAMARARGIAEPMLILGADTACVQHGRLIGTPQSAAEAREMLHGFRSAAHEVVTGVALIGQEAGNTGIPKVRSLFASSATVNWGDISDAEIETYIESGAWQGKAGAYNLRERVDAGWPIECEGDPNAVMGLPVAALSKRIQSLVASRGGAQ